MTDYVTISNNLIRRLSDDKLIAVNFSDVDFLAYFGTLSEGQQKAFKESSFKVEWDKVRTKRNKLLSDSDWTQLPDVNLPDEKKVLWCQYRKQLREITNVDDPFQIVWPPLPS